MNIDGRVVRFALIMESKEVRRTFDDPGANGGRLNKGKGLVMIRWGVESDICLQILASVLLEKRSPPAVDKKERVISVNVRTMNLLPSLFALLQHLRLSCFENLAGWLQTTCSVQRNV